MEKTKKSVCVQNLRRQWIANTDEPKARKLLKKRQVRVIYARPFSIQLLIRQVKISHKKRRCAE